MSKLLYLSVVCFILIGIISCKFINKDNQTSPKNDIPEYLSITSDTNVAREKVLSFIEKAMKNLMINYQDTRIREDFDDIVNRKLQIFKEPDSWHVTCLYIGKDQTQLENPIYKNFVENVEYDITSSTLIYIPNKLMTATVFFENASQIVDNKFPHVTLMLGGFRAVDSNYIQTSLYENNEMLRTLFNSGYIKSPIFRILLRLQNVKIYFKDLKKADVVDTVYFIKFGEVLELKGFSKKNYYKSKLNK